VRSEDLQPTKYVKHAWVCFALTLAAAFISEDLDGRWLAFTMVAVAAASFIFLAIYSEQKWLQGLLKSRFLIYSGKISYGLYLLHKIPADLAQTFHSDRHPMLLLPVIFVGAYVLAALSWSLLEKPFLGLKRYFAIELAAPGDTTNHE
jgi:peptidoglycan/LPS O-acetylase OafA/YrhL